MDQLEARLECLKIAERKYQGMGGVPHPSSDPAKIVADAQVYSNYVLGDHVESASAAARRKKGADET